MAERKVINKYYPPDFDPSKLPRYLFFRLQGRSLRYFSFFRTKRLKNKQQTVNMMMPMSVTCKSCGQYIYRGTKFNSKKETVQGEDYLGILIFRFYMKCPNCSAEFTIKTDPKHADYSAEFNCSRQMEPWREEDDMRDALLEQRAGEEQGDAMKELENKTLDSKMEMEILDGLDEIRALNARAANVNVDDILAKRVKEDEFLGAEDEMKLLETFEGSNKRLLHAEDEINPEALFTRRKKKQVKKDIEEGKPKVKTAIASVTIAVVEKEEEAKKKQPAPSSLLNLAAYK
jgi:hypothetical protein